MFSQIILSQNGLKSYQNNKKEYFFSVILYRSLTKLIKPPLVKIAWLLYIYIYILLCIFQLLLSSLFPSFNA